MSEPSSVRINVARAHPQERVPNVRVKANRSKSVESGRRVRQISFEPKTLEEAGYYFNSNNKLVSLENDQPFQYSVSPNKADDHKRYEAIGKLVAEYIYGRMESDFHLQRISIPVDARRSEPTGFFFASDDFQHSDYLMIIIHGMGAVRAGQWSRSLVINQNLSIGSQFDYIHRAQRLGYAVIVTNTNFNTDESSKSIASRPLPIRGSATAEEHACYIWDHFVRHAVARHICIVAHSYGGAVLLELANKYTQEFDGRVFAVALTDSPMKAYKKRYNANILRMLKRRTINWIAEKKPVDTVLGDREYGQIRSAGHTLHEWTSYTAFDAIFRFFTEERQKLERSKR